MTCLSRMHLIRLDVLLSETLNWSKGHGKCKRLWQSTLQARPDFSQGPKGGRQGRVEGAAAHTVKHSVDAAPTSPSHPQPVLEETSTSPGAPQQVRGLVLLHRVDHCMPYSSHRT